MKSVIIFDFDYTLADSSRGAVECINYALQAMGETPRSWDDCCETIGLSLTDTYQSLTRESTPEKLARFQRLFVERADQVMASSVELYDGVGDLVRRLTCSGYVLGILSTKFRYRICQILERYEIADQFSVIVGGEDVNNSKPDPEGLHLLLSKASMKPEQAVLVGDSLIDAETALRSGIEFIAVLTGTTAADQFTAYSPKAVLESIIEFEKYV